MGGVLSRISNLSLIQTASALPLCALAGSEPFCAIGSIHTNLPPPARQRVQIDGGSNCNFFGSPILKSFANAQPCMPGSIGGIAAGLPYDQILHNSIQFDNMSPLYTISALSAPVGSADILSESLLLDEYGIEARKKPPHLLFPDGSTTPMHRENGCYFIDLNIAHPPTGAIAGGLERAVANAAQSADLAAAAARALSHSATRTSDLALLWSARFNADADGVLALARSNHGIDIERISTTAREAVNASIPRAIAQARHAPTASTPARRRASKPAEVFICDGFGQHYAASPLNGSHYQFHAVCEKTSYGYIGDGKTHTVGDWISFFAHVIADAKSLGHEPKVLRFDRGPELVAQEFKNAIEEKFGVLVEYTPREHHEGVGRAERNHDLLTRDAEAMLQRASLGTEWLLPARSYAQWQRNRTPMRHSNGETRHQQYVGTVPNLRSPVPYIFGTTVSVVEDVRGPKGSLEHPRGSTGKMIGIEGSSYLVWRDTRRNVVHQNHVRPLNELALIRSSLAPSVAVHEAEAQTTPTDLPPLNLLPPQNAPANPPASKTQHPAPIEIDVGEKIEVLWYMQADGKWGGSPTAHPTWWTAQVTKHQALKDGRKKTFLSYQGWPGDPVWPHDLASSEFTWRLPAEKPAEAPLPLTEREQRAATRAKLRSAPPTSSHAHAQTPSILPTPRSIPRAALAFIDTAIESAPQQLAADAYNAAVFQALGDIGLPFECCNPFELDRCRANLAAADLSLQRHAQANKATQGVLEVKTDSGFMRLKVPATYKQLGASEQKEEWILADQKALDAILSHAGNRLVPQHVAHEKGIPIAPCVTQRRIKIDQATQRLESRNPFKSRHCVDGGRLAALLKHTGNASETDTASAVADDMLIKMVLADASARRRSLLKADVPNAYPQGKRLGRPLTYMALPTGFAHLRSDDQQPLCIELTTPMWGEAEAGHEWQIELENTLREIGWRPMENVPAAWRFTSPTGDCTLLTIVDDLLFSESPSTGLGIARETVRILSEKYGDLRPENEPTSFAGYCLTRSSDLSSITLSMGEKIHEACAEHAPELLQGHPLTDLPHGKRLQDMADHMQLCVPRPVKLNHRQTETQRLIGSLKFIEKVQPRISLVLHRLSCVMAAPPPEAWDVARAALSSVHENMHGGITFGGAGITGAARLGGAMRAEIDLSEPAPQQLEAHADATWGDRNVYGLILTYNGGAIFHQTKKIALTCDSSMETEAIASAKGAETITYAREVERGMGVPDEKPTLLTTDNLANQKVGAGISVPTRSKHFIRRYAALRQRIEASDVVLKFTPDASQPADFLTKWIPTAKLEKSLAYATNGRNAPRP